MCITTTLTGGLLATRGGASSRIPGTPGWACDLCGINQNSPPGSGGPMNDFLFMPSSEAFFLRCPPSEITKLQAKTAGSGSGSGSRCGFVIPPFHSQRDRCHDRPSYPKNDR
ncbi:hypothetical protein BDZ45DRAFT_670851 [Acephala macrosclerotiorum]|nr:hypothetical protein BDZ45DRAFT_670851 [Acephala macrosclerotiorum]